MTYLQIARTETLRCRHGVDERLTGACWLLAEGAETPGCSSGGPPGSRSRPSASGRGTETVTLHLSGIGGPIPFNGKSLPL